MKVFRPKMSQKRRGILADFWRNFCNWIFLRRTQRRGMTAAGYTLDKQQIEAVVACEDAQLVLASAGSGKTLSLLAKIEYLVQTLSIHPEEILAISFTKKTVEELRERCSIKGVEFRTFHSLGKNILNFNEIKAQNLVTDTEVDKFLNQWIKTKCRDSGFADKIFDFIFLKLSAPICPGFFDSHPSHIRLNRLSLRETLKNTLLSEQKVSGDTFCRDHVRSKEEQMVADWLYLHRISYEYAPKYKGYRPSFRIDASKSIFLDLVVMNQNGTSIYGSSYIKNIKWRRRLHAKEGNNRIEMYSYEWNNGDYFKILEQRLRCAGVKICTFSQSQKCELLLSDSAKPLLDEFKNLTACFLSHYKNGMFTPQEIKRRIGNLKTKYEQQYALDFWCIFKEFLKSYQAHLNNLQSIDFADMINSAICTVQEIPECASGYKYILLDEVQDLSKNRFCLVKTILDKNPTCRLFAVGDDWQSIYRFTGSDLSLVYDFDKNFQRYTRKSLIETTHRFGAPTTKISSTFIQANPAQSHKRVFCSNKDKQTPISIVMNDDGARQNDSSGFNRAILQLISEIGYEKLSQKELQIISRYNHDVQRLKSENVVIDSDKITWTNAENPTEQLNFEFCSMHKSKGITRDIVFVLNMNADLTGMPATRESNPLIEMLLSKEDAYPFAEERRLFYVAITRARERTILIANSKNPSPFLYEISEELAESRQRLCPKCQSGELVKKNLKKGEVYYCSNYKYGCDYVRRINPG